MCFLFSGTSIAIIFILTYFQGHLYKIFSDIQEVTQFCTTDFCSDPIRLLAESCVYATFEVWSVNQLDRREHSSYSRILKNRKLFNWIEKKKIPWFVYIWQNWQHYTDYWLEDHLFSISLFLGWWIGFIKFCIPLPFKVFSPLLLGKVSA